MGNRRNDAAGAAGTAGAALPAGSGRRERRLGHRVVTGAVAGALLVGPLTAVAVLPGTGGAGIAGAAQSKHAAGATPACGQVQAPTQAEENSTTGVTSNSLRVANISIQTGPVPGLFEGATVGTEAYFNYINSKGGVNGRKIQVDASDDGFSGTTNQALTQQAMSKDFAMVGNFSLFDSYGCKVLAQNPAVPDVSVTLDPGTNALPNDFSAQPLAGGVAEGPYLYLKNKYPSAVKKVGNLVANQASSIAQWNGQKKAMEHMGYKVVYVRDINPLQTDFTTDVINMRNAGVQFLYLTDLDWQVAATVLQNAAQQNWHPQVVMSAGPIYSKQFVKAAGGAANVQGVWLGQGQSLYLGEDANKIPAVKTFDKWVQKTKPGFSADLFTAYGWTSAQLFTQALKAAGKNPTRGTVLRQLDKITHYNASNLIGASNPAAKIPPNCYILAQIKNGKFVRVADPSMSTDSGYRCDKPYYYANTGRTSTVPQN